MLNLCFFSPQGALTRRSALAGGVALLAWPAVALAVTPLAKPPAPSQPAKSASPKVWPQSLQVPGGVARLALGAAPARPVAFTGSAEGAQKVPLLVLGDTAGWTALVGIPLAAKPGASASPAR